MICHGDYAPYNCVFDGTKAVGIIDFDTAHPGPRVHDIAYALYRFAPLTHADNADSFGGIKEQAARARLFCDSYGNLDRIGMAARVADRLRELVDFMRGRAASGDEGMAADIARGDDLLYIRDIDYIEKNADIISRHLAV